MGRGVLVGVFAVIGLMVLGSPASAITWGTIDTTHPNVGAILIVRADGSVGEFCSGTLVSARVFLTAGHCTDALTAFAIPATRLRIGFGPNLFAEGAVRLAVSGYQSHPDYNWGPTSNPHDLGVIVLQDAVEGVTLGTPAPTGYLDDLAASGELKSATFINVGYGDNQDFVVTGDRQISTSSFRNLHDAWLYMSQNIQHGDGGTCFVDSGRVVRCALRWRCVFGNFSDRLRCRRLLRRGCWLVVLFDRGLWHGLRLRLLSLDLRRGARRDLVGAALEDLEGDLELLRFERPEVELFREVHEVPFLLGQIHRLPDQLVIAPFRRRLQRRVADPVDIAPDRPGLFQVDVGQDRADVVKAQRVEVLRILHGPEDRGPDRFVLAQVVRLDPIRRQGSRLVDVRDDLVEVLEGDGAVPEDLVPGCRTCEVFLEPHDGFRETFDLRNVDPLLRRLLAGLRGLVRGIEGERRVERAERFVEAFQVDKGQAFAVPRDLVAGVEAERLIVRPNRGIELAGPFFCESSHVPQGLVGRPPDRPLGEGT